MKEKLFGILAVFALLFTVSQSTLPKIRFGGGGPVVVPYADCQGGGDCSG